jgi:hypothetical protein
VQVLDDPAGNSFLQGLLGETDPHLTVEHYQRSSEQDKLVFGEQDSGATDTGPQQENVRLMLSQCLLVIATVEANTYVFMNNS